MGFLLKVNPFIAGALISRQRFWPEVLASHYLRCKSTRVIRRWGNPPALLQMWVRLKLLTF